MHWSGKLQESLGPFRHYTHTGEAGCVFLDGTPSTVYDARPETCQRFPHVVPGNGSIASLPDRLQRAGGV